MNAMKASDYGLNEGHMIALEKSKDVEEQLISFFKNNPEIDGVVTADNISGTVAINALKKLNKSVPEQVSIIGFTKTIANLSEPRLVAIRQDCKEPRRSNVRWIVLRVNPN